MSLPLLILGLAFVAYGVDSLHSMHKAGNGEIEELPSAFGLPAWIGLTVGFTFIVTAI